MTSPQHEDGNGGRAAMQSQLQTLTERVDESLRDIRQELRDHYREERAWQTRVEDQLREVLAVPTKLVTIEKMVFEHDRIVQQSKGAALAGRLIWVVLGAAVSGLIWLYTHVSTLKVTSSPKYGEDVVQVAPPGAHGLPNK